MTTLKNAPLSPAEIDEVKTRVERVNILFKQSTSAWLNIASEFVAAKNKLKQLAYEKFINDVGVTKSVADKLLKIGSCTSLYAESNLECVSSAEGWTVLYALASLEEKQITALLTIVANDNKKLTREMIHNFSNNKPLDLKRLIVASIEIDESHIQTLSNEKFNAVKKRINEIQQMIDSVNAGFVLKQRENAIKTISSRAAANSASTLVQSAA